MVLLRGLQKVFYFFKLSLYIFYQLFKILAVTKIPRYESK